jgi:hypothetical protein
MAAPSPEFSETDPLGACYGAAERVSWRGARPSFTLLGAGTWARNPAIVAGLQQKRWSTVK